MVMVSIDFFVPGSVRYVEFGFWVMKLPSLSTMSRKRYRGKTSFIVHVANNKPS